MSTVAHSEVFSQSFISESAVCKPSLSPSAWETLCGWLTRDLHGMMATVERREEGGDWVMECHPTPLESVTTHETANGVRVVSIGICMNGICKQIEITGTQTIGLRRNAAGWPIRVDLGYEGGQLALIFSGERDFQHLPDSHGCRE